MQAVTYGMDNTRMKRSTLQNILVLVGAVEKQLKNKLFFVMLVLVLASILEVATLLIFARLIESFGTAEGIEGGTSNESSIIVLAVLLIISAVLASVLKGGALYGSGKIGAQVTSQIGKRLLKRYLINKESSKAEKLLFLDDPSYMEIFSSNVVQPLITVPASICGLLLVVVSVVYISGIIGLLTIFFMASYTCLSILLRLK